MWGIGRKRTTVEFFLVVLVGVTSSGTTDLALRKAAQGEYEFHDTPKAGTVTVKVSSRWALYNKNSSGYRLDSEILMPDERRVVQHEELDDRLVPVQLGYEFYLKGQKRPGMVLKCDFAGGAITCRAETSGARSIVSKPYEISGPFWLWLNNMTTVDMAWLFDGAVNMVPQSKTSASIATIVVSGGGQNIPWEISTLEKQELAFIGTNILELNGTKISAKHYKMGSGNEPMNLFDLWIAGPGLLVKMSSDEGRTQVILTDYRQYEKLIPELKVDNLPSDQPQ
jgi:hypothetical protein